MPFKSEKQRRFLHANHPEVAKDWEEKYENAEELPVGHYDTHVRLRRGGRWNAHTVNVRKTEKELIKKFLDQGFRIVKPGEEDEEHPRDSMYLKDDPEALKKALAYHRRNVAKLRRKSLADLTDEEYDSLKHSEGELELNEGEENNERYDGTDEGECESCGGLGCEDCNGTGLESTRQFILNREDEEDERYDDRDPVDDDALERARREEKLMGDIKVDHGGKPKSLKNIRKGMKDLDDKIKRMQSFKEFYNGK